jgi:hypothetical protein
MVRYEAGGIVEFIPENDMSDIDELIKLFKWQSYSDKVCAIECNRPGKFRFITFLLFHVLYLHFAFFRCLFSQLFSPPHIQFDIQGSSSQIFAYIAPYTDPIFFSISRHDSQPEKYR